MDTIFQPQVCEQDNSLCSLSDKSTWTNTELLLDMLRMLDEMSAQIEQSIRDTKESKRALDTYK